MRLNVQMVIVLLISVAHVGVGVWLMQYAPVWPLKSSGATSLVSINLTMYENKLSDLKTQSVAPIAAAKRPAQASSVTAQMMLPVEISLLQNAIQLSALTESLPSHIAPQSATQTAQVATPAVKSTSSSPPRFDAVYLNNPMPQYPSLSKRLGEEGKVMLRVLVDAAGKPKKIEMHTSSGIERLDIAAIDAVKRWQFVPAREGNEAVDGIALVPIYFQLS